MGADLSFPGQQPSEPFPESLSELSQSLSEPLLRGLEALAISAARAAGTFIVRERPLGLGVLDTKSSVNDVVTVMDQRSEALLRAHLLGARPDDAILGEEDGASEGTSGITWVIDPIDGTVNYLYQIPAYCVSVAAVVGDAETPDRWRPIVGAICNPLTMETFHARVGGGAHILRDEGDTAIRVNPAEVLAQSLVATGFGYLPEVRARQGEVLAAVLPEIRDIRRAGSAALDLCAVACGTVDGYYESGLNAWDLAAGWVIASEAGALVSGLNGMGPGQAAVVAAGRGIHGSLLSRLEALAPLR
ncbi:MAG: monophosphatase [Actinomycetota bacterium]|jgi:myo-inositol-1(or 4)-monophosphatase|nr:monophosphatase [Actinomycetota bacterium]